MCTELKAGDCRVYFGRLAVWGAGKKCAKLFIQSRVPKLSPRFIIIWLFDYSSIYFTVLTRPPLPPPNNSLVSSSFVQEWLISNFAKLVLELTLMKDQILVQRPEKNRTGPFCAHQHQSLDDTPCWNPERDTGIPETQHYHHLSVGFLKLWLHLCGHPSLP